MFQKNLRGIPIVRILWPIALALNALLPVLIREITFISSPATFWKVPVRIGR